MPFTEFDVEFNKDGRLFKEEQANAILRQVPDFTDLLVLCHGWNNDSEEARKLYGKLSDHMSTVLGVGLVPRLNGRKFAAIRIFWPSKRLADEDLLPGGRAAAHAENDTLLIRLLEEMKRNPMTLGGREVDTVREAALQHAQSLVPRLDTEIFARREFVFALRSILNPAFAHPDDGSDDFFTRGQEELFSLLSAPVKFDMPPRAGSAPDAACISSDLLSGIRAAARRITHYAAYYEMKERAGMVGAAGLNALLQRMRDRHDTVRLHLIGHSFGGRVVAAAAHALLPKTGAVTLSLLQAAFSHNALAQRFDDAHDGAFRALLSERRASGPIIVTHTKNDGAVGIAYPIAARIAQNPAAAFGDQNDPYGGMGRNGALHTPEAVKGMLLDVAQAYRLAPEKVFNLNADSFIKNHGDVTGPEIAYAILNAAGAV